MNKLQHLKELYNKVCNASKESLSLSLEDVHHKGLFSLVFHGTEFGSLTRAFIAYKEILPYSIQLHTHKYPIKLTTLWGAVKHYSAKECENITVDSVNLSIFNYKSPLNGGNGLEYERDGYFLINEYYIPQGSTIQMDEREIHTVSCSTNSIWIVEELGNINESSRVLGVPFSTNGLYNKSDSYIIASVHENIKNHLNRIISSYENLM